MYVQKQTVTVTTDASGDATEYTTHIQYGKINRIEYTKTNYADGVDFVITGEDSGKVLWQESGVNASKSISPRQEVHTVQGEPIADQYDDIVIAAERIKIVVDEGGDTKKGTFTFYLV